MPEEKQAEAGVKKTISQQKIEYVQPPEGVPQIYTNNVAIAPNPFDLRLYFGEILQAGEQVKVLHKAEVIMSWVEAKILANFLQRNVDAFEKKNGPITFPSLPDPPEMANPFGPDSKAKMTRFLTPRTAPKSP
jgi:hypothetical protein